MQNRLIGVAVFLLLMLTAMAIVPRVLNGGASDETTRQVAVLKAGAHRRIVIETRPVMMARALGLYYTVTGGGTVRREKVFFGTLGLRQGVPDFVIHRAKEGDLVAVATAQRPTELLILHDFARGTSWPAYERGASIESLMDKGRAMLQPLAAARPDRDWSLLRAANARPIPPIPAGEGGTERSR